MSTVLRIGGWRIMIYVHDHRPAHVHVVSPTGRAKLMLNCPGGPIVAQEARGIDARTLRHLMVAVDEHLQALCQAWRMQHGDF